MRKLRFFVCLLVVSNVSFSQLDHLWSTSMGGLNNEIANSSMTDGSGNMFVVGTFSGTCDFDPSPTVYTLTSFGNSVDVFLAKFDINGVLQWVDQIGGTGNDYAFDIANMGGVAVICGMFEGTADFNPAVATASNITSLGLSDGFFAQYNTVGALIFAKRIGSASGDDKLTSVVLNSSLDMCISGCIGGTADVDPGPGVVNFLVSGTTNAFIGRYSPIGNYSAAAQITGAYSEALAIATDGSNVFVTGCFASTNDFNPSATTNSLTTSSLSDKDVFVASYNLGMGYIYAKQIGGPGTDIGRAIGVLGSGFTYIGGEFSDQCDFDPSAITYTLQNAGQLDIFHARYQNGNFSWAHSVGGPNNDRCNDLSVNAGTNDVYTTGFFDGVGVDFDPSASTVTLSASGGSSYLAGYTGSGLYKFAYASITQSEGQGVFYNQGPKTLNYCGRYSSTDDFDFTTNAALHASAGQQDAFMAKYYVCTAAPSQPTVISGPTLVCEGATTTYTTNNIAQAYGYGWMAPIGSTVISNSNTITVTYSNSSGAISVNAYNSCGVSTDKTVAITVNPKPPTTLVSSSSVICLGETVTLTANGASTYTWSDASNNTSLVITPSVSTSYTVVGTGTNGCSTGTTITQLVSQCTELKVETQNNIEIVICPNPNKGEFSIIWNEEGMIELYDVNGKLLINEIKGIGNYNLNINNLNGGIYLLKLSNRNFTSKHKIIKLE